MKPNLLFILMFLLGAQWIWAQGTRLLRQPTVSERHIAFVYADDLWVVDREGGDARRLTSFEGTESFPHFSPDGSMIAFTGQYDGNTDVYVIPTGGGDPRRLTWHPGVDIAQGWTPDGKEVLFRSNRAGAPTRTMQFYTIGLTGGLSKALPIPQAAFGDLSADGRYLAYTPIQPWDPEWRNYRGGTAQPIWIVDLQDFSLKQTPRANDERHQDPVWYQGKVYFLSERDFANNIWSFDPKTDELRQITFHKDFDVKSIDACQDRIVYEQGGYLHLLDPATGNAKQLTIEVRGDLNWARPRWEDVRPNQLQNASLSPTGKRALFEYRGDIFTVPKEDGDWRNLTQSSNAADRYPVWSPDGQQIAWFSDAGGAYQLVISDQMGLQKKTIAIPNPTFFFRPEWSPDGKFIAFTDTHYNLWYTDIATGTTQKIDTDGYAHPNRTMHPVWSPDSKWVAYAQLLETQFKVIKVHNIATGQTLQLTDGMADAMSPAWDESGKYLYFLASTDYGLNTGWLDMSSYNQPVTRGVYAIVLAKNEPSPLAPKSDEEEAKKDKNEDKDKDKSKTVTVSIDMESIDQRIIAIEVPLRDYAFLVAGPEGHVFYAENIPNQPGLVLHRYSFQERKAIEFLSPVSSVSVSHDRKQLLYGHNGTWGIVKTDGGAVKSNDGALKFNLKMKVEPLAEWRQMFDEGWRLQRDFLYVDNLHGAPWKDIYTWYSPWLEHVRHRTDLNYLLDVMGAEIAVGHSYVSGGNFPDVKTIPVGLLGADFEEVNGFYRIAKIYTGENWNPDLKSPLSGPGLDVRTGDYLLEVNGVALRAPANLYSLFEGTANRQVQIKVNSTPSLQNARSLTVVPVANEAQLRLRDWVEGNRRKVAALSDGKLAYVYVPNTGGPGYTYFNRYYFAQQDKRGVVIDERNNGGGSAADYMIDIMARKLHGYFNSKAGNRRPFTTPMAGIWGPKVMIINESAGSGGDLLPYMFRKMQLGTLVGTRTWGGLVGIWDTPPLVDGGRMLAPRGGFFDTDGNWAVEGEGIAPDIEVLQEPAKVIRGGDPQLERAVQEALKLLETEAIELKPEPAPPVRYMRPKG
ncbi:MAG TPA: PDZ domain-containing protein [Saprospiraceae bacterium]|nr:PDZ domain-containing protein [Saprospiraceae bacterium]HMP24065.1 PDZ domain-containing protein [Saprospiraceae bacterium]